MSRSRFNGWTAVSIVAATALMGFCVAGGAIACGMMAGPVLSPPHKPAVARATARLGIATVQVAARL